MGRVTQGIGGALREPVHCDEGNSLSTSFSNHHMSGTSERPAMRVPNFQSPAPTVTVLEDGLSGMGVAEVTSVPITARDGLSLIPKR